MADTLAVTHAELVTAIFSGQFDDTLESLGDAVILRRKQIALRMRKGDRVRFTSATKPRYLVGVEATVERVNQATISVLLDEAAGKFSGNRSIRVPVTLLEPVSA
jgi:hypothetical protein